MAGYKTFTVGEVLTQSDTQQYLINGPHFEATRGSDQSISNSTSTDLSWTVENTDRQGMIAVTTTTFTVASGYAGVWLLTCFAEYAANATGIRTLQLLLNGSTICEYRDDPVSIAAQPTAMNIMTTKLLVVGDAIKVQTFQLSGGSLAIDGTSKPCRFSGTRLSD